MSDVYSARDRDACTCNLYWKGIISGVIQKHRSFFLFHLKPTRVAKSTLRYTHTFGLGGSAAVLAVMLFFTGILLMLGYEASPEQAYKSVLRMDNQLVFGGFVRNIHHWSANLLVAVAVLHMFRVFFTGGYHSPRRLNWVLGVALLLSVLASNFTGYLLPWDQLSYWAVTICTGMLGYIPWIGHSLQSVARGGPDIGQGTLVIFYALHTSLLPTIMLILMGFHFWRVRKAKGVVLPASSGHSQGDALEYVPTNPHLLMREFAVGLTVVSVVLLFSAFVDAPLGEAANPGMSPNPAKAPWYFMGFQELQLHFHPLFSVLLFPLLLTVACLMIPFIRYNISNEGIWFLGKKGKVTASIAACAALVLTPAFVIADEIWLRSAEGAPSIIGRGVVPMAAFAVGVSFLGFVLARWAKASRAEIVQATFVLLLVSLSILTATGIWFRGPGMALTRLW